MNGKKVSAALSALPEELVAEAMEPGHSRRGFSWLRLAACVAIVVGLCFGFWPAQPEIVTAPGLLTVTVYAMDENSETGYVSVPLYEGINVNKNQYTPLGLDIWPGIPVELSVNSNNSLTEQIRFEISVSSGQYLEMGSGPVGHLGEEFSRSNGTIIYWDMAYEDYAAGNIDKSEYDQVYTYIVIYEREHIVGYTVLRFDRLYGKEFVELNPFFADVYEDDDPVRAYYSTIVESVYFPKVNSEYQSISLEYVEKCIASVMETQ